MVVDAVVLIPGGLFEDMDATRFWIESGVAPALERAGLDVVAVDRLRRPRSWTQDAAAVAEQIRLSGKRSAVVVAGSNGCSTAVRLAIDHPSLVARLVLCWPATAKDDRVDGRLRDGIEREAGREVADVLLAGTTLRGVSDDELRGLELPAIVIPSEPENPFHQRTTVDTLARLLPDVFVTDGAPESVRPEFADSLPRFLRTLLEALDSHTPEQRHI